MNQIPRFTGADLGGIAQLLDAEGIPFDFEGVTVGATGYGATSEYYLVVNEAHFVDTCSLLMDYYSSCFLIWVLLTRPVKPRTTAQLPNLLSKSTDY